MKKMRKWKRITAGIIAATVVFGSVVWPEESVEAETDTMTDTTFDEENVVLKIGVLSDLHLLQKDTETAATAQGRVQKYANAVATLDKLSGNDLDMLMLAGDYTNQGTETQATMFASATKGILDAINTGKNTDNKTQFVMTYGNHDTCWTGCMDVAGWETVLNSYGLLDNATICESAPGCYKVTVEREGKTYAFFSIETVDYNAPSNMFYQSALDWLDTELKATTTENPNTYVYVVSHAPIAETGVYGADIAFEKNADWATAHAGSTGTTDDGAATSSDIDGVLAKYPQAVYFSGHTHKTNVLESTIMQDDYTAITVSGFNRGDLYSTETVYLDGSAHPSGVDSSAYGLYVAVDKNGNQRIERVKLTNNNMVTTTVTYSSDYVVDTVSIPESDTTIETLEKVWDMAYPSDDKSHLTAYTSARGVVPTFADSAAVTVESLAFGDNKESVSFDVSFDTATCTNKIIRYELQLVNQNGKVVDNSWILGNWTNHTTGIVNEGETHLNATKLKYSVAYTSEELSGCTELTAKIYAVDEFGVKSEALTSAKQELGILKPSASGANYNMFDGMTADRVLARNHANYPAFNATVDDEMGKLTVSYDTVNGTKGTDYSSAGADDLIVFALDKGQYEYTYNILDSSLVAWSLGTNAEKLTELSYEDTFVYELDINIEEYIGNGIYIAFRSQDSTGWQTMRSGLYIGKSSTGLYVNSGIRTAWTTESKFLLNEDLLNKDIHLTFVSTPTTVSVWFDEQLLFSDASLVTPEECIAENTDSDTFAGDTTTFPYWDTKVSIGLRSKNMIPAIGIYTSQMNFTVKNQMLYLYDTDEQVVDEIGADERNYYDASKVSVPDTVTLVSKTANSLEVDEAFDANETNAANAGAAIAVNLDTSEFSTADTVITEFDYTPTDVNRGQDSGVSNVLNDILVRFRKDSSGGVAYLLIRNGTTILYHGSTNTKELFNWKYHWLNEGQKLHLKIVSSPTQTDLYINGILIKQFAYPDGTTGAMPYLELYVRNGHYKFENISVRKVGGTIEDVTPLTADNNLLAGEYGEAVTNIMVHGTLAGISDSVVNDKTNLYTDMTWMNLSENGASSYYDLAETFRFFGKNNSNYRMQSGESYVMSSLVRVSNGTLMGDDNKSHLSRVNVSAATYDGKEAWYFIENTKLHIMNVGSELQTVTIDLASEIGYQIGDYIRLTTVVSPYGYDIYIDGLKIYTYTAESNTYIDYSTAYIGGKGAEVRFIDTAVWYNTADGELYKEELLKEVRTYETLPGIYLDNKEVADVSVASIKEACNNLSGTSNETLQQYVCVIDKLIASGKVVNNMVYDGTATIAKSFDVDMDGDENDSWAYQTFSAFTENPFTLEDSWILEADVTCLANWSGQARVGLILQASGEPDVMILGNNAYYYSTVHTQAGVQGPTWQAGESWRVKYVVDPTDGITTTITDISTGTQIYSYTVGWDNLRTYTSLVPCLYLACGDYEVRNVYVGYDLTDDIASLNTAISETGSDIGTVDYTLASIKAYEEALAAATNVSETVEMHTKQEINDVTTTLTSALKVAEAYLTVGDGDLNHSITFGVADGETLPVGEYLEGTATVDGENVNVKHYVIDWTANGEAATEYDADVETTAYTPNFIDTKMLDVKIQSKAETDGTYTSKIISSIDDYTREEYSEAGFVLSTKNPDPLLANNAKIVEGITTVYQHIWADGEKYTVNDVFNEGEEGYSNYMFAVKVTKLSLNMEIYVRAFVKLQDGTVIYGEPCTKTVTP